MARRSWSHEEYILYSCFDLPVHSVFTYDEFCGRMSTSIFKNSSSAEIILNPYYLPDYLSVSYDYGLNLKRHN